MKNKKTWLLILSDAIFINLNYIIALWLRFELQYPGSYVETFLKFALFITAAKLIIFSGFSLYKPMWKYASVSEMLNIIFAVTVANIVSTGILIVGNTFLPRSIYPIVLLLDIFLVGGIRMIPKVLNNLADQSLINSDRKKTLLVGAGESGRLVMKELKNHPQLNNYPVAFVDDDPEKLNKQLYGITVMGNRYDIPRLIKELDIEEIIVCIPSMSSKDQKEILNICSTQPVKVRIVPGVYQMIDGKINFKDIRDIEIDDLLGREVIKLNLKELENLIKGKTIMVTGGGGSIGSELCRQIAKYDPKLLVILDIYENTSYDIQNELKRNYKDLNFTVLIESVRDRERIDQIMSIYKPNVVFHAAAHKHVPLMEDSPESAIKNNVFGTLNVALECDHHGVEKFVLISTDKAVNPTNIMGATKRICEMIIQSIDKTSKTNYVAVRFGNVLGSSGSVIPLFLKQINAGGPVTVTDEKIIRYFMSIPEATSLVLQAGAIAKGGEIFVLDMGEPVKIIDLAEKLIRLYGYEPYKDIKIDIVGLRPGEKLYEELLLNLDLVDKTTVDRIYVEKPSDLDFNELEKKLIPLNEAAHKKNNREGIVKELENIVPTFKNYIPEDRK